MLTTFRPRDILSIHDLHRDDILFFLETAKKMKEGAPTSLLRDQLLGSCFFEPSTRTRLSFEAAMKRLGGDVLSTGKLQATGIAKGESLHDTARIIGQYVDIVVVRHPLDGAARLFAEATNKPVINAGDGANQHPTQTLIDLFTIQETQGTLENLDMAVVGDLRYGRAVHSLTEACAHFNSRLYFVSPPGLEMPDDLCNELRERGLRFSFHKEINEIIDRVDILYMTRIQAERMPKTAKFTACRLSLKDLEKAKNNLCVLHPLPRLEELPPEIDSSPHAHYFEQAQNGLYVRQALLALLLEKSL